MARYKIWDKQEDIYTPGVNQNGKGHWTAEEYISQVWPWAANPNIKCIIGGGAINGSVFMEFEQAKNQYKNMGAEITDDMTDREVLDAIEYFEDHPPVDTSVSADERIASALEFQNLMTM